ncbi:hypothetical protein VD0004_g1967 [Verticillium dahliae]|uniref:Uncharacterized protein n=1 Tax=Verticillium dahliae TaxID=27337 RepID=A0A366NP15_VERDA|nr:hypothetical protein VD0004_g1967 [Verticillium dahliae]PNH73922.1 hypothetical protein VD0001_g3632 [Verticillium dahliae]RBQ78949.1 hypothetical protein VDGD_05126 [Verticillium dahliae]RXG49448.1 hypothetical protein VDGE_05126 [Verticillium dahliae]
MAPPSKNSAHAKSAEQEIRNRGSSTSGAGRTPAEGATAADANPPSTNGGSGSQSKADAARPGKKGKAATGGENSDGSAVTGGQPRRLKALAEEKLDGRAGNPSQLGDPISLEVEDGRKQGEKGDVADGQRGGPGRESKL